MSTQNEIFCVYVNPDKSLDAVRVLADNESVLADKRDVIMMKFRRPNTSGPGFFEDEYSGWPCFSVARYRAKVGITDGCTVTRCRPKDGPTSAEGRDVHYDDDNKPGDQQTWPAGIEQASMGNPGPRLKGYDTDASDWDSLLQTARALDPDNTSLTT